jgi:lactoylglutathione lyase
MGFASPMRSYRFIYTGIRVRDMDESLRFYTERLGMEVVDKREQTPPTEGEVVTLRSPHGVQRLELNWYAEGSRFGPPYSNGEDLDHLAFEVDDLDGALAELATKGVEVLIRPGEIGGWREAFIKDPDGIWIELLQRKKS